MSRLASAFTCARPGRLLLGLAVAVGLAQPLAAADPVGQILGKPAATGTIPYMLYLPRSYNTDAQATFPLVVCLGGVGEVGNGTFTGSFTPVNGTNELPRVLDNGPLRLIENGVTYFDENPTIVIHPENPDKNYSSATIDATITQVATNYRVDPNRIYVTGYSQGGGGAWLYGKDHGTRLAALVPIAGGAYPANPAGFTAMSGIPVWAIHNAADPTVPSVYTTGTTTAFTTPAIVGWINGIAAGQGGITQRCLDTYPSSIGFSLVSGVIRTITGVTADRSAHYHPSTGWAWNDGTVFVAGDYTQLTLYNDNIHEGWSRTYGTGTGDFNRPFWNWLLGQRKGQAPTAFSSPEIIVDNADTAHTSANGTWPVTTGAATSYLGGYASPGTGSTFTFTPTLPDTANYQVYVWYSGATGVNLSTVVPVTVHANGANTVVTIDEAFGAGHWVLIGTYACGSGTGTTVTFGTTGANGIVSVDAVRFVETPTIPANTPPTIAVIANQTMVSGATVTPALTIGDAQTAAASLTVQASSDNTTLFPSVNLVLGGSGASRTLAVTPANGLTGSGHVIVSVTDAAGLVTTTSFTVTVNAPSGNTPPTITGTIPAQTIALNGASGALAFTIGDAETAPASLVVSPTSSDTTYLPNNGLALGGSGANRTITVTPASGRSGTATVTITVTDAGGLAATKSFTVTTAAPTNSPPTISAISSLSLPVSGQSSAIPFTVGDAETAVTALTVTRTSSNLTYLPLNGLTLGGSGANRTLTIAPAAGLSGASTVTVTVTDGGGLTGVTTFTVSSSVAGGPTIAAIANQNLTGGSASAAITVTITDPQVGFVVLSADLTPSGSLTASDFTFFGTTGARTLVISPDANAAGSYQVTVTATDANQQTAATTFTVVVTPASTGSTSSSQGGGGGGGGGGGCGLGSGAYALAGLFMLVLRALALAATRRRD